MHPYSIALFISSFAAGATALIALSRRQVRSARFVVLQMAGLFIWSFTYAFYWLAEQPTEKLFWLDATYLGVVVVPTAFFCFSLEYTGYGGLLTRRAFMFLGIEPTLASIFMWTDRWHGLFFAGKRTAMSSTILDGGPVFWAHVVYSYSLLLIATILLVWTFMRSPRLFRRQTGAMLVGAFLPWLANLVGLLKISPLVGIDLTPIAFTLTGITITVSLLGYRLFEIVPVARHLLVENMGDGIIVLDNNDRIVDINKAALYFADPAAGSPIGMSMETVFASRSKSITAYGNVSDARFELILDDISPRVLDVRITPLYLQDKRQGRMIVWHDITDRKEMEMQLREANRKLHRQISETKRLEAQLRVQAIRDPLTNLFNRRYLAETLPRELARAERERSSLGVAIFDIDNFKAINDTYGHPAGDRVLQAVSAMLQQNTRRQDIACRYGGDEFVVIIPKTSLEVTRKRAEEWQAALLKEPAPINGTKLQITISIGIAAYPGHGKTVDSLLRAADKALYDAKDAGRDQIKIFQDQLIVE